MESCVHCDSHEAPITVLAVRLVDGEFLDSVDYCRTHALELAISRRLPLSIPRSGHGQEYSSAPPRCQESPCFILVYERS